jgi:hypothetical protein
MRIHNVSIDYPVRFQKKACSYNNSLKTISILRSSPDIDNEIPAEKDRNLVPGIT